MKMKAIGLVFILLLGLSGFHLAPSGLTEGIDRPPCPTLFVMCPSYVVSGSSPITLSLDVSGAGEKGLKDNEVIVEFKGSQSKWDLSYNWDVSGGNMVGGQRARTVQIESTAAKQSDAVNVLATVEVGGMDPACSRTSSCSLKVDPGCKAPEKLTEYGDLSFEAERERLDNFATHLLGSGPDSVGYILAYGGRRSCFWEEGELRAERAKNYLAEQYRIERDRIIAFDGGFRKNLTVELFLSSRTGCGPFPTPTIRGSRSEIEGSCLEKYKRRNEPIKR
jgi:hypothetical protein